MLFNSLEFVVFFIIVYAVYLSVNLRGQNILLLFASYFFYSMWDWRFLSLILISTIVDYFCGKYMYAANNARTRKILLIISLTTNLSLLGFFKYFGFFVDSFKDLFSVFGVDVNVTTLEIILPVGISFYTFQTLSYTIDIYRGKLKPELDISNFALFVAFFPQLVAGPIERAVHLLPQLTKRRIVTKNDVSVGLWLITYGYVLKVFVADNLAPIVDYTFAKSGVVDGSEALTSVYAFAFQIFGDFAGYSGIAIGVSRLMGIKLMTNFLYPYFVTNPQDFWRNWHISLSTWLRDYLYIGLGGNRGGEYKTYRNLFLTMLLGGIWHGAALNFVIWGIYQGGVLIFHRISKPVLGRIEVLMPIGSKLWFVIKLVAMFHITCYGWLIFRADSVGQIVDLTNSILLNFSGLSSLTINNLKLVAFYSSVVFVIQLVQKYYNDDLVVTKMRPVYQICIILALYFAATTLGEFGAKEFIYFQF